MYCLTFIIDGLSVSGVIAVYLTLIWDHFPILLQSHMRECCISIQAVVDINNDGFICEEEYVRIFKNWGHTGAAHVKKAFHNLKPVYKNGVSVCDVAQYWIDFTTEDNPAKTQDEVENGLESNVEA